MDPKTVKRKVLAHQVGQLDEERAERAAVPRNTDPVRQVVLDQLRETGGRGEAKRLLPVARTSGRYRSATAFGRVIDVPESDAERRSRRCPRRSRRYRSARPPWARAIDVPVSPQSATYTRCQTLRVR